MLLVLMLLTQMVFFWVIYVFLQTLSFRKYSFLKLTQLSQGNNGVDDPASNTDCFLWRDTCVSSTQLNRPIRTRRAYHHLEKSTWQEVFCSKTNSTLTGKQCAGCLQALTYMVSLGEIHAFLKLSWICHFGINWAFFHHENYDFSGSIPLKN
jgi:hypothetical protein